MRKRSPSEERDGQTLYPPNLLSDLLIVLGVSVDRMVFVISLSKVVVLVMKSVEADRVRVAYEVTSLLGRVVDDHSLWWSGWRKLASGL